jgi:hypothetical protein
MDIDDQEISKKPRAQKGEEFTLSELTSKRKQDEIKQTELRLHCVSVRLNGDELIVLDKYRGRSFRGEALRMLAFTNLPSPITSLNAQAWQELSKASANLNQISHHLNSGASVNIEIICEQLDAFRAALLGAQL